MKQMNISRNFLVVIILIAGFIFVVSFSTLYAQNHIYQGTACSCTLPIPVLIPTLSSLGVFVGSIVYYLLFPKIEDDRKKYLKNMRILIDLLAPEESQIINMIVENNGKVTQAKVSSVLGKVKAHRLIKDLETRKIVEREQYGKTKIIKLTKKFSDVIFF